MHFGDTYSYVSLQFCGHAGVPVVAFFYQWLQLLLGRPSPKTKTLLTALSPAHPALRGESGNLPPLSSEWA